MSRKHTWTRQELRSLYKELNDLCYKLDNKYDINCGGCCYVAYCIADELQKRHIRFGLVLYGSDMEDYSTSEIRNNILGRFNCFPTGDETTNHYAIKLSHIGVINGDDWEDYRVVNNLLSEDIRFIYDNGDWNRMYHTSNNNKVHKLITKFFNQYEKVHFIEV